METKLFDLVSGRSADVQPGVALAGRFRLGDKSSGAVINGLPAHFPDRLVPRRDGSWSLSLPGHLSVGGEFPSASLPTSVDAEAVVEMGKGFQALRDSGATWDRWTLVSPLVPMVKEYMKVGPLDQAIQDRLVFLEAVCQNPRTHLRVEEEMTSVARVRRVAPRAVVRLLSHKEDWDRPTVLGVRPRRVLALVAEDDVNIYENRVAARLIDHLSLYLRHRLEQLARIRGMIDESGTYGARAMDGHFRRQWRLCEIWADGVGDTLAEQNAKRTTELIESLYGRVRKLIDSPLYRGVPRRSGPVHLRYTNIFESEPHYREVAKLWTEWSLSGFEKSPTEQEVYDRKQTLCDSAAWFGWLLVVRALTQLGVMPRSDAATAAADCDELPLTGPAGEWWVLPPRDGAVVLRGAGHSVRVICLPGQLQGLDALAAQRLTDDLEKAAGASDARDVLVLTLSSDRGREQKVSQWQADSAYRAGNWEPGVHRGSRLAMLPVSPWDIGSVERVARALRWHLWTPMLLQHPPTVAMGRDRPNAIPAWAEVTTRPETIRVLRPPDRREQSVADFLQGCRTTGEARVRRENPKAFRQAVEQLTQHLERIQADLLAAFALCSRICTCPVCKAAGASLRALDEHDCFECRCASCESMWGVYRCACGMRFPVIRLKDCEALVDANEDRSPGWFDRVFGADLLTGICPLTGSKATFVCPACGTCRCGDNAHSESDRHALAKPHAGRD